MLPGLGIPRQAFFFCIPNPIFEIPHSSNNAGKDLFALRLAQVFIKYHADISYQQASLQGNGNLLRIQSQQTIVFHNLEGLYFVIKIVVEIDSVLILNFGKFQFEMAYQLGNDISAQQVI